MRLYSAIPDNLIPKDGELKDNFIARCMNNEEMQMSFSEDQRRTQCQLLYEEKSSEDDPYQINLFGVVGEEITAARLAYEFEAAGEQDVDINLYSGGGDVMEAGAIVGLIRSRRKKSRVRIFVQGLAASAGAYIAVTGDVLVIEESAMFMIHNAWTMAVGNKDDLRNTADKIEKQQQGMVEAFVKKTGKDKDEIQKMLDDETWMNADEAVELGFADAVFMSPEEEKVAASIDKTFAQNYKNIPESVVIKTDATKSQKTQQKHSDTMDDAILKACDLKASADASDVIAYVSDLKAKVSQLQSDLSEKSELADTLQNRNEELQGTVDELKEQTKGQELQTVVSEVLDEADVELADEPMQALQRRAERYVAEDDEQRRKDMKEDMIMYASAKGVETGRKGLSDLTPLNDKKTSTNEGETPKAAAGSFEQKLLNKVDTIQAQNPDMDFDTAMKKARQELDAADRKAAGMQ